MMDRSVRVEECKTRVNLGAAAWRTDARRWLTYFALRSSASFAAICFVTVILMRSDVRFREF